MDHFFIAMDSLYKESEICYSGLQILNKENFLLQRVLILNCFTTLLVIMEKKETKKYGQSGELLALVIWVFFPQTQHFAGKMIVISVHSPREALGARRTYR